MENFWFNLGMIKLPEAMADSAIFASIDCMIDRLNGNPIWMTKDQKYRGLALDENDEAVIRLALHLMQQTLHQMRQDAFVSCDGAGTA
jgi:hypothetical protein